jgi:hypothetical protein
METKNMTNSEVIEALNCMAERFNEVTPDNKEEDKHIKWGIGVLHRTIELLKINNQDEAEKLQYKLIWNEDSDRAWGTVKDFESEDAFIEQIRAEFKSFDGKECVVENIEKQWMLLSGSGLPAEMAIPITNLDIEIGQYYSADVYEVEENE